jgi:hypothetical protein
MTKVSENGVNGSGIPSLVANTIVGFVLLWKTFRSSTQEQGMKATALSCHVCGLNDLMPLIRP